MTPQLIQSTRQSLHYDLEGSIIWPSSLPYLSEFFYDTCFSSLQPYWSPSYILFLYLILYLKNYFQCSDLNMFLFLTSLASSLSFLFFEKGPLWLHLKGCYFVFGPFSIIYFYMFSNFYPNLFFTWMCFWISKCMF